MLILSKLPGFCPQEIIANRSGLFLFWHLDTDEPQVVYAAQNILAFLDMQRRLPTSGKAWIDKAEIISCLSFILNRVFKPFHPSVIQQHCLRISLDMAPVCTVMIIDIFGPTYFKFMCIVQKHIQVFSMSFLLKYGRVVCGQGPQ